MASVRLQAFDAVEAKLEIVVQALGWRTLVVNPRDELSEDELNAIVFLYGGEPDPASLSGNAEVRFADFAVGVLVIEEDGATPVERVMDAAMVAVADALLDANDRQLGGLVDAVMQGAISEPVLGRGMNSGRIGGEQFMEFRIEYLGVEGDASTVGP